MGAFCLQMAICSRAGASWKKRNNLRRTIPLVRAHLAMVYSKAWTNAEAKAEAAAFLVLKNKEEVIASAARETRWNYRRRLIDSASADSLVHRPCAFSAPLVVARNELRQRQGVLINCFNAAGKARDENRDDEAIRLFRRARLGTAGVGTGLVVSGTLLYEKEQYAEARDVLRQF